MKKGEVWFVEFPLEEDPDRILNRPVIVLDENLLGVLSVKITKHKAKIEDPYDIPHPFSLNVTSFFFHLLKYIIPFCFIIPFIRR